MAFVARQNMFTIDSSITNWSAYNLKVIRLVIKTILEAAEAEKTVRSRANAYWYLDTSRINSGDLPSEDGGSDSAIYELSTDSSNTAYGCFFRNADNETMLLSFTGSGCLYIRDSEDSSCISLHPISGSITSANSDQSQAYGFSTSNKYLYGLSLTVSKNNFGGYNYPWLEGFFTDGDIKPLADVYVSYVDTYSTGYTVDVIVGIDGKNILIDRRISYDSNRDHCLIYGNYISPIDNTDTETDCLLAIQSSSSSNVMAMFRDKAGSTTFNPGSSYLYNMRRTSVVANTSMVSCSNQNRVPYTGLSLSWDNIVQSQPNSVLNDRGFGYKGITNPNIVRLLTADSVIQNKSIYDDNGTDYFVIAKYYNGSMSKDQFSIAVPWYSGNPTINN